MDSKEKAILKTLLYADLFDYPLTKTEISNFLISDKKIETRELFVALKNQHLPIEELDGYFYLSGKKSLVMKRKEREKISVRKLKKAKEIINKISFIPSIKLIGISGALSMKNCDEDDDIDLFVITDKQLAWMTRLLLVILLTVFGVYRNRSSKDHSNKICLNMILDESNVGFTKGNQDLYTAHEIVQLLPIFNKAKMYEKFIGENLWVKNYIPNFKIAKEAIFHKNNAVGRTIVFIFKSLRLEAIARFLQLSYMKNHQTKEITRPGFLKFHPYDYKKHTLTHYGKNLLKYGLR
jgi:hypothetical protein